MVCCSGRANSPNESRSFGGYFLLRTGCLWILLKERVMKRMLFSCAFLTSLLFPLHAKAEWVCRTLSGEVSVGGGDAHQEPDVRVCDWVGGGTPPGGGPGGGGTGDNIVPYS